MPAQQVLPAEAKFLLEASGPVGAAISTVTRVLETLGLQIKGKTVHLSYDQVNPSAEAFSRDAFAAFARAYTKTERAKIAAQVAPLFLTQMSKSWGITSGLNQTIARDLSENVSMDEALARQLWLFIIWVGTNVDAESSTSFSEYVKGLFPVIFAQAVANAELSLSKLRGETSIPHLPNEETVITTDENATQTSGNMPSFAIVGGIVAVAIAAYFFWRK